MLAPLAVKVVLAPLHILGEDGLMLMVGNGFTVTVTVLVCTQALPSCAVKV